MRHYQYLFLNKDGTDRWTVSVDAQISDLDDPQDLLKTMDQLGDEGWEAYQLFTHGREIYRVAMRREEAG